MQYNLFSEECCFWFTIGQNDLTPIDAFEDSLRNALQDLISTGADIIVSTIPNFVSFPYFTEFGHLAPISANQANAIFAFYGGFNTLVNQLNAEQGAGARSTVTFFDDNPSSWRMVVEDPNLPDASLSDGTIVPKYRQLNEGELVLWSIPEYPSAQNESSGGLGLQVPITKQYFLSTADLSVVDQLILDYNSVIRAVVAEFEGISLVDLYTELNPAVQNEIVFDGVAFDYSMRRTGIFSADGLNLNQRGQAILANVFIKIMNERYQANISTVNPNDFPGNTFRNAF